MSAARVLPGDWYSGEVPENVVIAEGAYVETSLSFKFYRSRSNVGLTVGSGSGVYGGTMFDVGPEARVNIGEYVLVNGAWIISDAGVEIGDYTFISWRVLIMDTYRLPFDPVARRPLLRRMSLARVRGLENGAPAQPIRIGPKVWIGFDVCILPGVSIGEGSIVGAKSVVTADVPPYSVAVGNPARVVRRLVEGEGGSHG